MEGKLINECVPNKLERLLLMRLINLWPKVFSTIREYFLFKNQQILYHSEIVHKRNKIFVSYFPDIHKCTEFEFLLKGFYQMHYTHCLFVLLSDKAIDSSQAW